jgi:23S rRNA (cytosine1962-C5)-methyltransferase
MSDDRSAAELPTLRLKRNEDRRLQAGHVWVFSNEVDTAQTPLNRLEAGQLVRVLAHNDRAMGLAYVNPNSLICARLLSSWQLPDRAWFATRLRRALQLRERLFSAPFYRWVYGESDFLPGLIIDRFDGICVLQINTAGMERLKDTVLAAMGEVLPLRSILVKNDSGARELEHLPKYVEWDAVQAGAVHTGAAAQRESFVDVLEGGCTFNAPLVDGQKTGWFFDQAANRDLLARFVVPQARVLDVFSYVGAWGVRAAHAGAKSVTCVDASAAALEAAVGNGERNGVTIAARRGDAFDVLEALAGEGAKFDLIVVDPPAFAKRKKDIPQAIAAYKRINQLAMKLIVDGGILIACSCSYHVGAQELRGAIGKAGRAAERSVQILAEGSQSPDHPVHPAIEETRYLKAFYCRIGDALK